MSGTGRNVMSGRQARRAMLLALLLGLGFAAGRKAAHAAPVLGEPGLPPCRCAAICGG